jgi:hypothetical protein
VAETSSSLLLSKNNKRTTRGKVTFDPANPNAPVTLTVDTTTVNNRGRKVNSTASYTQNDSGQFVDSSGKAWTGEGDKQAGLVRASMGKKINDTKQSNEIMDEWAKNNRVSGTNKKDEGNAGGGDGTDKGETENKPVPQLKIESTASRNFGDLKYPLERTDGQDYCKITQYKYKPNEFKLGPATRPNQRMTEVKGTVILPIPPGLVDSNSSNWQGHTMNQLQSMVGQGAMDVMNSGTPLAEAGETMAAAVETAKTNSPAYQEMVKAWAMGGIPGLGMNTSQALARGKGAIINPNEELLFQGPAMRSMDYGWRLTPRFQQEATMVQKIIRFFKQGSAAQVSSGGGLFLVTPNVFHVQFYDGKGKEHPFIGKRKKAALASMSVNYVPDGTYMTLPNSSMTAYDIGLSFMELEPILEDDYHKETISVGY